MKKTRTLSEMCDELYDDPEIAAWVREQVGQAGTEGAILDGSRVLPHPIDAERNYKAAKGLADMTPTEERQASELESLKSRLAALEQAQAPSPETPRVLEGI